MGQEPAAIRQEIEQTRERLSDTVDALRYNADIPARTKDQISDKVAGVKERFTGARDQLTDATPDRSDLRQAGRRSVGIAQENPLGLAIGAVAVGFVAGLLVPSTPVEDRRVGPVSDQIKTQARQSGHDALQQGKDIARDVQGAAGDLADTARETAKDVGGTVQETAQDITH